MKILGILASVSAAYEIAAKFVVSKISGVADVKQVPNLFHTGIGASAGVLVTVVGGLFYYLFGSTSDACKGAPSACVSRREWLICPIVCDSAVFSHSDPCSIAAASPKG